MPVAGAAALSHGPTPGPASPARRRGRVAGVSHRARTDDRPRRGGSPGQRPTRPVGLSAPSAECPTPAADSTGASNSRSNRPVTLVSTATGAAPSAPPEQPQPGQPDRHEAVGSAAGPGGWPGEQILFTAEQAGAALAIPGSWLREKAAGGQVPCRRLGKHLRFARADLDAIAAAAAQPARSAARTPPRRGSTPAPTALSTTGSITGQFAVHRGRGPRQRPAQ